VVLEVTFFLWVSVAMEVVFVWEVLGNLWSLHYQALFSLVRVSNVHEISEH
jgi:hypothetical protein